MGIQQILYINSVSEIGGAEASLIELVKQLNRTDFGARLVTTKDGPLAKLFREAGWPVYFASFPFFSRRRPWIYWREILRLMSIIRRENIDIIHVNCDRAVPHAVLAAGLTQTKVLCHIHDMTRAWFLPPYVKALNQSDRIIANSKATARKCIKAGMDNEKIQVIYECFEFQRFKNFIGLDRSSIRAEWGLDRNTVAIGLVGQILPHKGHMDFLQAAVWLRDKYENLRFIIVGDDKLSDSVDFFPSLRKFTLEQGLEGLVIFTGFIQAVAKVMAGLDILVVPSWEEPFGRVVVDGLASSLPVVATNTGGIPEIITNGETGILIPSNDPEKLGEVLLTLCKDPKMRTELGKKGPSVAVLYDVNEHTRLFEETYQSVIENRVDALPKVPFGEII